MVRRFRGYSERAQTFEEDVKLISVEMSKDDEGFPITLESSIEVMANELPVTSREFYSASQANFNVSKVFEIHEFEFDGQTFVEHEGKRYKVVRTYKNEDLVELSCERVSDNYA